MQGEKRKWVFRTRGQHAPHAAQNHLPYTKTIKYPPSEGIGMERAYTVVVEKGIDGYYIAEVPELPGCYSQGKTTKELMAHIKEAIELYIETAKDLKERPKRSFVGFKEVVVNA